MRWDADLDEECGGSHDPGLASMPPADTPRGAHNPKVVGSNPTPATNEKPLYHKGFSSFRVVAPEQSIVVLSRAPTHLVLV